jgi:hypothetical protein
VAGGLLALGGTVPRGRCIIMLLVALRGYRPPDDTASSARRVLSHPATTPRPAPTPPDPISREATRPPDSRLTMIVLALDAACSSSGSTRLQTLRYAEPLQRAALLQGGNVTDGVPGQKTICPAARPASGRVECGRSRHYGHSAGKQLVTAHPAPTPCAGRLLFSLRCSATRECRAEAIPS